MSATTYPVALGDLTRKMYAGMSAEQRARENEHAARLRKASRDIIAGPVVDRFGNVWIPTPRWEPEAVKELRTLATRHSLPAGRCFRKLPEKMFDAWVFPAGTVGLEEARELYVRFFSQDVERERAMLR